MNIGIKQLQYNRGGDMINEKTINYEEMEWEEAKGYPAGTKIKVLRHHGDIKTFLLKLPASSLMEAHCHTAPEQHFILEGAKTWKSQNCKNLWRKRSIKAPGSNWYWSWFNYKC